MDYVALKNEILTDPKTIGYAGKSDSEIANLLNDIPASNTLIYRGVIDAYEVVNNTVPSEFTALTTTEQNRYIAITGTGKVDTSNANVRAAFAQMFSSGSATRTALLSMSQRSAYRWEELGLSNAPTHMDVAIALRG